MISRNGELMLLVAGVLCLLIPATVFSFTVVIDAGHGGTEKGAVQENLVEKDLTLIVARGLRANLIKREGMRVVMTRDEDVTVSWEERARIIEEASPDLVISIHFNTDIFMLSETRGLEIYYPADDFSRPTNESVSLFDRNNRSFAVGKFLRDRYLRSPLFVEWKHDLNLFAQRDLKIFRLTRAPILLFEIAYLTSPEDKARIGNGAFLEEMARFLADTIAEWVTRR